MKVSVGIPPTPHLYLYCWHNSKKTNPTAFLSASFPAPNSGLDGWMYVGIHLQPAKQLPGQMCPWACMAGQEKKSKLYCSFRICSSFIFFGRSKRVRKKKRTQKDGIASVHARKQASLCSYACRHVAGTKRTSWLVWPRAIYTWLAGRVFIPFEYPCLNPSTNKTLLRLVSLVERINKFEIL